MGITVNSDKTMSIDEEKFKASDMSNVGDLFSGAYSFGEKMTDRINQIYATPHRAIRWQERLIQTRAVTMLLMPAQHWIP